VIVGFLINRFLKTCICIYRLFTVYPDPNAGDVVADFNCRRPTIVGRTPKFPFRGKSALLCFFDSNGRWVRVAEPEVCYMAKAGQTWTDVYYPAVDLTPVFRDSGFPYDVFQWAMSGWSLTCGRGKTDINVFEHLMGEFLTEAAKAGEGLKAIVVIGLTNDVNYCRYRKNRGKYPSSVDQLIESRDEWLKKLAVRLGAPIIVIRTGSVKVNYVSVTDDVPLGYIGDKTETEIRDIIAAAHARIYNRLGEDTVAGPWPVMSPTVYYLQKPHLNGREADWLGRPGKNEAYLQGLLIHNALAWICVKASWIKTANG
jgi:hypothetical protein